LFPPKPQTGALYFLGAILVLFLCISLGGCATGPPAAKQPGDVSLKTPFAKEAYKVLAVEVEVYNAAWLAFKDLNDAGLVPEEDFQKGKDLARNFYKQYTRAVDVVLAYEKGTGSQGEAKSAVDLALAANKMLQEYLRPKLPKKKESGYREQETGKT